MHTLPPSPKPQSHPDWRKKITVRARTCHNIKNVDMITQGLKAEQMLSVWLTFKHFFII